VSCNYYDSWIIGAIEKEGQAERQEAGLGNGMGLTGHVRKAVLPASFNDNDSKSLLSKITS
jgi:hypothetical protein